MVVGTTASAAEVGRNFKEGNPNRQITADGASEDADASHSWVGPTWPITKKKLPQTGVFLSAARSRPWARRMLL